jgi:hypothetical protein
MANIRNFKLLRNQTPLASKSAAVSALKALNLTSSEEGTLVISRYNEDSKPGSVLGVVNTDGSVSISGGLDSSLVLSGDAARDAHFTEINIVDGVLDPSTSTGSRIDLAHLVDYVKKTAKQNSLNITANDPIWDAIAKIEGYINYDLDVAAIGTTGQAIVSVSQTDGKISATAGDVAAAHVTVEDSAQVFTGTNVETVLKELYDAIRAVVGDATASGDTLGELEDRIETLEQFTEDLDVVDSIAGGSGTGSATGLQVSVTPNTNKGDVTLGVTVNDSALETFINTKVSGLWHFKGTVATVDALPATGNLEGDVYQVTADSSEWAWNGTEWVELGTIVDLTPYQVKSVDTTADNGVSLSLTNGAVKVNVAEGQVADGNTGLVTGDAVYDAINDIDAEDVALASPYQKPATVTPIAAGDSVQTAIEKLDKAIENAVAGGVNSVTGEAPIVVDNTDTNNPVVGLDIAASNGTAVNNTTLTNPIFVDANDKLNFAETLDAGYYA